MTSTPLEPSKDLQDQVPQPSGASADISVDRHSETHAEHAAGFASNSPEVLSLAPSGPSLQEAKSALDRVVKEKTASLAAQAAAGFESAQGSVPGQTDGANTAFERALIRKSMSTMFDRPPGQSHHQGTSSTLGRNAAIGTTANGNSAASGGVASGSTASPQVTSTMGSQPGLVGQNAPDTHPVISNYTDFRLYLRDVYEFRRAHEGTRVRPYSYSTFSAAADIKSPNYLKLIIEGRRNLSDDMVAKFAKALRLHRAEADEFRVLVHYGQASQPIDRNQFLKELADLRARRELAASNVEQQLAWDKVPDWIGWVLYAMVDQADVKFDPESLQKLFRVRANPEHIRASLQKLIDSGDVAVDPVTKAAVKPREMMDSPQDLPVAMIRKLQAELIYLGIESLFRDSPKDREFGALTMALTHDEFEHVKFELRQLRKRLHKDTSVRRKQSKGERVYQLNVQLFPVSEKS